MKTNEGNKLIAEFMGHEVAYSDTSHPCIMGEMNCWSPIKYHKSWDWLMPVIQKIGNLDFNKTEGLESIIYYYFPHNSNMLFIPIDLIYDRIIKLITWYNENK